MLFLLSSYNSMLSCSLYPPTHFVIPFTKPWQMCNLVLDKMGPLFGLPYNTHPPPTIVAQNILPYAVNKGIQMLWGGKWKAGSHQESNTGHLWLELPLSHNSRITTKPCNPLYVLHKWYWMPQSHTWQPLHMCCQNSVNWKILSIGENPCWASEWFSHSKCSEHLASRWK